MTDIDHAAVAGTHSKDAKEPKTVEIEVNTRPVQMAEKETTGSEIKSAAIAQGVPIQPNFVLQLEQPNGTGKVIGDNDPIRIHPKMSFTAIAADDNS